MVEENGVANYLVLRLVFASLACLFGVLFASAVMLHRFMAGRQNIPQSWFGRLWRAINRGPWLSMPELMIRRSLQYQNSSGFWLVSNGQVLAANYQLFFGPVATVSGSTVLWGWVGLIASAGAITALLPVIVLMNFLKPLKGNSLDKVETILLALLFAPGAIFWIIISLETDVIISAVLMALILPSIGLATYFTFAVLTSDETANAALLPSFAGGLSFMVTFFALLLGEIVTPGLYIPQTLQMLFSNFAFDLITIFATLALLTWSVEKNSIRRIPIAILTDIFLAAIFASCSLFFGLVFTDQALTIIETLNVLQFKSPDGESVELGPFFWAMHTTFLPTVGYLSFVMFGWVGKTNLWVLSWFSKQSSSNPEPFLLTASVFFVLFMLSGGILGILEVAK